MRTEDLLRRLESASRLETEDDIGEYEDAARQLRGQTAPSTLRRMLRCLRDVDAGEVQYELVEACEEFPLKVLVSTLLEETGALSDVAPEWGGLMLQTLMNHPTSLAEVLEAFTNLSVERQGDVVAAVRRIDREGGYSDVLRRLEELTRRDDRDRGS